MSVTITSAVATGPNTYLLTYESTLSTPTFYLYQDGTLVAVTELTTWVFWVQVGESLNVEILDNANELPQAAFPGRLLLAWEASDSTDYYRIDEKVASVWTERAKITDSGVLYYSWETRFLEDVTAHEFRIVPVGTNGNEGAIKAFAVLMVRHPTPPTVAYTYTSLTAAVTVSAA